MTKTTSQKEEKQLGRFSGSHITILAIAIASIGLFVYLQEMALDSSNFLFLMFSSFIFLALGTLLITKAFTKSSDVERKLCLVVAIVFIVALASVANSLMHVPRGGFYNRTEVTPNSFTLTVERSWNGSYSGEYSQIIHTADYPEAFIWISEDWEPHNVILIRSQTTVRMNATIYVFMMLKPYEVAGHAIFFEPLAFNESKTTQYIQPNIQIKWGSADPAHRTRLNGYDLKLTTRLYGTGPDVESLLNFTVDMSNFRLSIDDYVVDSELQNGSSITLTGVFIGVILYIPGKFLHKFSLKKT